MCLWWFLTRNFWFWCLECAESQWSCVVVFFPPSIRSCHADWILMSSCQNNISKPPRSLVVGLMRGMNVARGTQETDAGSHAVLTCHMSFSLRSSEERRRCREYGKGTMRCFFFFFFLLLIFLWVGFLSRFIAATFCAHAIFLPPHPPPPCAFTHSDTGLDWAERSQRGQKKRRRASRGHALVEVVVCAVGRVVILPLVEMTAQSTALPALVTCDGAGEPDRRGRLSSLCLFANRINWPETECMPPQ